VLAAEDGTLLADELAFQASQDYAALPAGVIHADLFRDNVLWDASGALSGILDFYFAGADALIFDLAVVANDWCFDDASLAGLVAGYQSVRPLETAERAAWPAMRRAAALRFWLLRLDALHRPRDGDVVTLKDPAHFGGMLRDLRLAPRPLPR
jgi:homoserine kinase type II